MQLQCICGGLDGCLSKTATDKKTDRHTVQRTVRHMGRQANRQADRQTRMHAGGWIDRRKVLTGGQAHKSSNQRLYRYC